MFQCNEPPCLAIRAARGRLRVNSRQHRERQTACKPGSVPPCGGDGHSSGTSVAGRLARPTRAATRKTRLGDCSPDRSYLVLLPVGFTVPLPLPGARCALTAPFHPYPLGRKAGQAVCFLWHFPWGRPRRALPGTVFPWSPDFPLPQVALQKRSSGRLAEGNLGIARVRCNKITG